MMIMIVHIVLVVKIVVIIIAPDARAPETM